MEANHGPSKRNSTVRTFNATKMRMTMYLTRTECRSRGNRQMYASGQVGDSSGCTKDLSAKLDAPNASPEYMDGPS